MNLPEGAHLAYLVVHEAWSWKHTHTLLDEKPGIDISASNGGGGTVAWEFVIEEAPADTVRLLMFSDSWAAFTQMPEFFAALKDLGPRADLKDVRDLLDRLGAIDETDRDEPQQH